MSEDAGDLDIAMHLAEQANLGNSPPVVTHIKGVNSRFPDNRLTSPFPSFLLTCDSTNTPAHPHTPSHQHKHSLTPFSLSQTPAGAVSRHSSLVRNRLRSLFISRPIPIHTTRQSEMDTDRAYLDQDERRSSSSQFI